MSESEKFTLTLSGIFLVNCILLLIKFYPYSQFLDFIGLFWPILGFWAILEIILKDRWGWGGILSQPFLFYCAIYFPIIVIINIISLSFTAEFFIDLSLAILGIIQMIFYYD
jgi:hypothetical protein